MSAAVKTMASHPGSIWLTLLAAVAAVLTGLGDNKGAVESIDSFTKTSESSSYQAIMDLRDKVDWIHTRVKNNEKTLAALTTTPGGPGQETPPSTAPPVEGEAKPEQADEEKEPAAVVPLKEDGTIEWAPIQRPAECTDKKGE